MNRLAQLIRPTIDSFLSQYPLGVVLIWGPTATGKTSLSLQLAQHYTGEIISADSRQVYQYMNIGTDKLMPDQQQGIPHHLLDVVTPDQTYTAGQRKQDTYQLIPQIQGRQHTTFIVGGTGLYIDMIYKNFAMPDVPPDTARREGMLLKEQDTPGYLHTLLLQQDPIEAQRHHPNSTRYILRALEIFAKTGKTKTELSAQQPVDRPLLMIGLMRDKDDTNRKINQRISEMFDHGLVDEVQWLLDQGYGPELPSMQGIGYKEIVGYLQGEYNLERATELLKRNTHHLAKKQRSRFRRYIAESKQTPKEGVTYAIHHLSDHSKGG